MINGTAEQITLSTANMCSQNIVIITSVMLMVCYLLFGSMKHLDSKESARDVVSFYPYHLHKVCKHFTTPKMKAITMKSPMKQPMRQATSPSPTLARVAFTASFLRFSQAAPPSNKYRRPFLLNMITDRSIERRNMINTMKEKLSQMIMNGISCNCLLLHHLLCSDDEIG